MLTTLTSRTRRWLGWAPPTDLTPDLPFHDVAMARVQPDIIRRVRPYTQTSPERIAGLCQAIAHIENQQVPGAIVECGVWRGGSMMAAALALLSRRSTCREFYLFDTFAGMPAPSDVDRDFQGRCAAELLREPGFQGDMVRAECELHEVRRALHDTRYPAEKMIFVQGQVEQTLPATAPERIALLRLDTDWYASTRHELETLYPRLAEGGILIVDDYGHWQGARAAVDEYFARVPVGLVPLDYTGRLVVKKTPSGVCAA